MTVKELKDYLATLPEETASAELVVGTSGHGYRKVRLKLDKAERSKSGELFEYWGDDHMEAGSQAVQILEVR